MDIDEINSNFTNPFINNFSSYDIDKPNYSKNNNFLFNNQNSKTNRNFDSSKFNNKSNLFINNNNIISISNSYSINRNIHYLLNSYDSKNSNLSALKNPKISFKINVGDNNSKLYYCNMHINNSIYSCEICGKHYTRKDNLKRHKDIKHSNYKGTICPFCNKIIIRIKDHIKRMHLRNQKIIKKDKRILFITKKEDEIKIINDLKDDPFLSPKNINELPITLVELKNETYEEIDDFCYYTNFNIGSGGTMRVYYGNNKTKKIDVAVKIDKEKKKKSSTINEAIILTKLKGIQQIPTFYDYTFKNNNNIIIENLAGPSLKKIISILEEGFELSTVCILGIQMINILESIHERFIIHNDITPSNICWGLFEAGKFVKTDKFFLIDFGYSKEFMTDGKSIIQNNEIKRKEKIHCENKMDNILQGTPEFMANQYQKVIVQEGGLI